MSDFRRPAMPGAHLFDDLPGDPDPAERTAAGHRIASLLVRGAANDADAGLVERVVHLADEEGLGVIAELWSQASAETIAGALWRLYVLRTWVVRDPVGAAREFGAGKAYSPVDVVLAGVVEPPGPDEVIALVDTVVSGIVRPDLDVALDRAASFAHVAAIGRAQLESGDPHSAARLLDTAKALHRAAELERAGELH